MSGPAPALVPAAAPVLAPALRLALAIGCVAAVSVASGFAHPSAWLLADPALGRLLRGIALIKGLLVLGTLGALWWRFGHPISRPAAGAYLAGAWAAALAAALVWQLTAVVAAAILFHVAELSLLVLALKEGRRGLLVRRPQALQQSPGREHAASEPRFADV